MQRSFAALAVFILMACSSSPDGNKTSMVTFETLSVPSSPNTWLIAPEGYLRTAEPDAVSPLLAKGADDVFSALVAIVNATPRTSEVDIDPQKRHIRYTVRVQRTPFKDDVDLAVLEFESGTSLIAYSRSRAGYSDFGVNERRLTKLLTDLEARLD